MLLHQAWSTMGSFTWFNWSVWPASVRLESLVNLIRNWVKFIMGKIKYCYKSVMTPEGNVWDSAINYIQFKRRERGSDRSQTPGYQGNVKVEGGGVSPLFFLVCPALVRHWPIVESISETSRCLSEDRNLQIGVCAWRRIRICLLDITIWTSVNLGKPNNILYIYISLISRI